MKKDKEDIKYSNWVVNPMNIDFFNFKYLKDFFPPEEIINEKWNEMLMFLHFL